MYLYCYGRSENARRTGDNLLKNSDGEWITDAESFVAGMGETVTRVDSAIVLLLPSEAAVKILVERFYPSELKIPILRVSPDGFYSEILRSGGYNTHEVLLRICSILGSKPLSSASDMSEFAPDLKKTVEDYGMIADDPKLLDEICGFVKEGGTVSIYSDMNLYMSEPVLDTLSYIPVILRTSARSEMTGVYASCCESDEYSVFITCSLLQRPSGTREDCRCLKLTPKGVVLGLELAGRAAPEYGVETVMDCLRNHGIDPVSVSTVAVSAMTRESDTIMEIASRLGCFVTSFDSRLLKAVRVPLDATFNPVKTSDTCTAAARLASDNGHLLIRRAGDKNSVIMSACLKKNGIVLTE